MKTIGLIGGMSWVSTAHYYEIINTQAARLEGGLHSAPIILHSLDFAEIEEMQQRDDWDAAGRVLADAARKLEAHGAAFIGITSNTMHLCAPAIAAVITVPLIHIATPTAEALLADGISKVGLLGTRFTMEKRFYIDELERMGLEVLVPDVGITNLNGIIYEELVKNVVRDNSRQTYVEAIARLKSRGAEAVILGCTEIGLLIDDSVSPLPVYDTTDIHAKALLAQARS